MKYFSDYECCWASVPTTGKDSIITNKEKAKAFLEKERYGHSFCFSGIIEDNNVFLKSYEFQCSKCSVTVSVGTEGSNFHSVNSILMFYPNSEATCEEIMMDEACK